MRPGLTTATHSSGLPLPLPMRVSAGFFVTGLSGNTRIHTLPPRLRLRVSATRAGSTAADAVGVETQRGRPRLMSGTADPDALSQLECAVRGDALGVPLRMHDPLDVELDLLAGPHLQLVLHLPLLAALATDDEARP